MRKSFTDTRVLKVVTFGAALAVGAVAAPSTTGAEPGGGHDCPTPTDMVDHFRRGLDALVEANELSRNEADDAGEQFADWVRTEGTEEFDCGEIRTEMMKHGREVLGVVGLDLNQVKEGFEDGQSLAEMADENGEGRGELVETLSRQVTDRIDQLERAGAVDTKVADAFEELAAERIEFMVDYERGDPLPAGFDHDRG